VFALWPSLIPDAINTGIVYMSDCLTTLKLKNSSAGTTTIVSLILQDLDPKSMDMCRTPKRTLMIACVVRAASCGVLAVLLEGSRQFLAPADDAYARSIVFDVEFYPQIAFISRSKALSFTSHAQSLGKMVDVCHVTVLQSLTLEGSAHVLVALLKVFERWLMYVRLTYLCGSEVLGCLLASVAYEKLRHDYIQRICAVLKNFIGHKGTSLQVECVVFDLLFIRIDLDPDVSTTALSCCALFMRAKVLECVIFLIPCLNCCFRSMPMIWSTSTLLQL
jgi:hypothetical protein